MTFPPHLRSKLAAAAIAAAALTGTFGTAASQVLLSAAERAKHTTDEYAAPRNRMVDEEIVAAGVKDPRVLDAMRSTPRHEFVPPTLRSKAYLDMALAIGQSQTISPPFVVAYMTEQISPQPGDKVLEIGTGSGYQAAVLSPLVKEVYSIEIIKPLGQRARQTLKRLKYKNVFTKIGDGYLGWAEHAPFDKIIVTCSPENVPKALVEQLRDGGRMIVPVGERYQQTLYLFEKKAGKLTSVALLPTLFVPMTGEAEAGRTRKPDPIHPQIANGSFEELLSERAPPANGPTAGAKLASSSPEAAKPAGWHYQRQLTLVEDGKAPDGKRYASFTNSEPGRASRALQGFAIDGRHVKQIEISFEVRGEELEQGRTADERAMLLVLFYDQNRAQGGYQVIGPWQGSFEWRKVTDTINVPVGTREIIFHLGMHGGTGTLCLDDIRIKAIPRH